MPPIVGVPALARCDCGPSCRMIWPIWKSRTLRMNQGPTIRLKRSARQAGRGRAERDVARDVQEAQKRRDVGERRQQVVEHQPRSRTSRSTTTSQRVPREPFTSTTSPGWIAASRPPAPRRRCWAGSARRPRACRPRPRRAPDARAASPPTANSSTQSGARPPGARTPRAATRRARPARASRRARPRGRARGARLRQRAQRLRQRRRAGVVGVVDHHDVVAQAAHHAAPIGRPDPRHAVAHDLERHAARRGHRGRRQHVGQVGRGRGAASRTPPGRRRVTTVARVPSRPRSSISVARTSAPADSPKVTVRPGKAPRRLVMRESSAEHTSSVDASAPSRISAFASAIASLDSKKPRWASPTLVQTRTSGSAMPTSVRISPA